MAHPKTGVPTGLAEMNKTMEALHNRYIQIAKDTGNWDAVQVQSISATERYNKAIAEQKLGLMELMKTSQLRNAALKEQVALQNSLVMKDANQPNFGKQSSTLLIPKNLSEDAVTAEQKFGHLAKAIGSASQQTINWGKNTQWAGRQLTAGFTMPVVLAAAAVGKLAYDMDAQLTHITKIYEYSSKATAAQAQEEAQLRADSINLAKDAAEKYGASMESVLQVEANFAATGIRGKQLMDDTNTVVRATTMTFQGAAASAQDYMNVFKATIALQNIFKLSTEDANNAMNYFNVVESQTSLRMKDVLDAIPRSFGPLHDLGLSYKEITVMLVAMKQNGVPAAQGANALKSAAAGMLNIAPRVSKAFNAMNIDIKAWVDQANGNVFEVMKRLSDRMKTITDPVDRQKMETALAALFGKQQMARLIGVVDSLGDIHDKTTQVGRAFNVAAMSVEEMAAKSDQQLKRLHNSLSGQLRSAIHTLQVELASIGDSVLPIFTGIVNGIASIMKSFDGLSEGKKRFALIAIGLGALIGPIVMMVGLFANAVGTIGKVGSALADLRYKFKMMDPETRVQTALNSALNDSFDKQGQTIAAVALSLQDLSRSFKTAAVEAGVAMEVIDGVGRVGGVGGVGGVTINPRLPNENKERYGAGSMINGSPVGGQFINAQHSAMYAAQMSTATKEMEASSEQVSNKWAGISKYAGVAALGAMTLGSFVASDNTALQETLSAVTGIAMVMTMLPIGNIAKGISNWVTGMGGLSAIMKSTATSMGALLVEFWPLVVAGGALAGGIILWKKMNDEVYKYSKMQEKISQSAKGWSEILGFTMTSLSARAAADDTHQRNMAEDNALVASLNSKYKEVGDQIRDAAGQQTKLNLAIEEGVKVRNNGGDAAQAYLAVRTALLAGNAANESNINDMMVKVHAQIDFGNPNDIAAAAQQMIQTALNTAVTGIDPSWKDKLFGDPVNNMSPDSEASVRKAASAWWDAYKSAANDPAAQKQLLDSIKNTFNLSTSDLFATVQKKNRDALKTLNINNSSDLVDLIDKSGSQKWVDSLTKGQKEALDSLQNNFDGTFNQITGVAADFTNQVASLDPPLQSLAGGFSSFNQLGAYLGTDANNMAALASASNDTAAAWENLANQGIKTIQLTSQQVTDGLKSSMSGTMDSVYAELDRRLAEFNQAQQDAIQKAGDAKVNAIDATGKAQLAAEEKKIKAQDAADTKQTKGVKKYYDDRIKALQNSVKAEQQADKIRQQIFDNELKRIQRLAEAANRSIDFNAALQSGNLDEAAKISNDGQAAVLQNNLDDQKQAAADALAVKQQAVQDSIDAITAERDAKLQALSDQQAAEKQALADEKQRMQDAIDANKKAEEQKTKDKIAALQKQQDANQRSLDQQLSATKALVPANATELRNLISTVTGMYNYWGSNFLDPKSKEWGNFVGSALTSSVQTSANNLQNSVKWGDVAKTIEAQMADQFGLTPSQLTSWLKTGVYPGSVSNSGYVSQTGGGYSPSLGQQNGVGQRNRFAARHVGGMADPSWTQHDRIGVPRSASLFHSEIPTVLKRGEFVMNEHAVARVGVNALNSMNGGKTFRHSGGEVGMMHSGGLADAFGATMISAMFARAIVNGVANTLGNTAMSLAMPQSTGFGAASAGTYGGSDLGAEQLQNASIIMNVGRSMGAGSRDLIVAIMTALQESSLRNLPGGDRDSVGLFQQRPSQGWGSVAEIMNPSYAAHKFFEELLKIKDRGNMSMSEEAQAVQRSADGSLYAKWASVAQAIVSGTPMNAIGQSGGASFGHGVLQPPDRDGTPSYRGGWTNHLQPGIAATVADVLSSIPGGQVITSAWRSHADQMRINPGAPNSDHPMGKAVDIGANAYDPAQSAMGDQIAAAFAGLPNVHQVLWKTMMGGNHFNHVHVGFRHGGGLPQLRVGGEVQYDNTIANLHKKETVLTAPLSQQLKDGIAKIDSGLGNGYHVTIDLRGAMVREDVDIEKAVYAAIDKREGRTGRTRVVS